MESLPVTHLIYNERTLPTTFKTFKRAPLVLFFLFVLFWVFLSGLIRKKLYYSDIFQLKGYIFRIDIAPEISTSTSYI